MDRIEKLQVVETILERASEVCGDITPAVMEEFYRMQPGVEELFKIHRPVDTVQLEAGMVEQALYCFMDWFKSPGEIKITLLGSVPHHVETLNVSANHYVGLLNATSAIIGNTIPQENNLEVSVWNEITDSLLDVVNTAKGYAYTATRT